MKRVKQCGLILFSILSFVLASCSEKLTSSSEAHECSFSSSEAHEHTFNNEIWEYDSEYHWHPSTCGHDVTSSKTKHLFTEEVIEPTYEANGYTVHSCTACNYSYRDNEISHEHKPGTPVQENKVNPTCILEGSYDLVTYCVDDHVEMSREHQVVPALGHDYTNEIFNATYESDGYIKHTCSRCGDTYNEITEAKLEHQYSEEYSFDETNHWYACLDTDYESLRKGAENHSFSTEQVVEPTKKDQGYTKKTCEKCGYVYKYNFVEALGYTITWKNWNDDVLKTDTNVQFGSTPSYEGTPEKESDAQFTYVFYGWDPVIHEVNDDETYVAQYSSTVNTYTVTFHAGDGYFDNDLNVKEKSIMVEYGKTPSFDIVPECLSPDYETAAFNGWDKEFEAVSSNQDYYATYTYSNERDYTVILAINHIKGSTTTVEITYKGSGYIEDWGDGNDESLPDKYLSTTVTHSYNKYLDSGIKLVSIKEFYSCYNGTKASIKIHGLDNVIAIYVNHKSVSTHRDYEFSELPNLNFIKFGTFYKYSQYKTGSGTAGYGSNSIKINQNNALEMVTFDSYTWSNYKENDLSDHVVVDDYAFWYNPKLKEIDFGDSTIKSIGEHAFSSCTELESINGLSFDQLTSIGESAFSNCKKLDVYLSFDSLTSIADFAFYGCSTISCVCVPYLYGTSISIGSYVFADCENLSSLSISRSVTSIGYKAFQNCENLSSINYNSTMSNFLQMTIDDTAFEGCNNLVEFVCTDGVILA